MIGEMAKKRSAGTVFDNGSDVFLAEDLHSAAASSIPTARFLYASFFAALVSRSAVAPLDRVNCLLQVPVLSKHVQKNVEVNFRSARAAVADVVRREGIGLIEL